MGEASVRNMTERCENTIGQDTLLEFLATLERAIAVVTPDSGPAHMGTAVGIPVVGLYAATNPARSGPYLSRQWCVDKYDLAARRLLGKSAVDLPWTTKIERPGVMDLITPDDVIKKLHSVLLALAKRRNGTFSFPARPRDTPAHHGNENVPFLPHARRPCPAHHPAHLLVIARNEAPIIAAASTACRSPRKTGDRLGRALAHRRSVCARHGARVVHRDWLGFGPRATSAARRRVTTGSSRWTRMKRCRAGSPANAAAPAAAHAVAVCRRDPAPSDLVHGRTDALVSADDGRAPRRLLSSRPRALDRRARARVAALLTLRRRRSRGRSFT